MVKKIFYALMLAGFMSFSSYAAEITAEYVENLIKSNKLETVDFSYVKKAIGNGTSAGAKALLLDARPYPKYVQGHIPSSMPFPDTEMDKYADSLKGVALDKEIIVYCGGVKCEKSPLVAIELKKRGYTNLKVYNAGMPEWSKKSYIEISLPTAQKMYESNGALFIDARPFPKFAQGTIIGSLNIHDVDFGKLWGRLPTDVNEKVVAYCGGYACEKSHHVAMLMKNMGYKSVFVYAGGFPEWKQAGLPTTTSGGSTKSADKQTVATGPIPQGQDKGTVDAKFVENYVKTGEPKDVKITIVDVKKPAEYKTAHLKGSVNIPKDLSDADFVAKLPKEGYIVLTCATGTRSLETYLRLKDDIKLADISRVFYLDAEVKCENTDNCKIIPFEY